MTARPTSSLSKYYDYRSLVRFGIVGVVQNGVFYIIALGLISAGWKAWQSFLVIYPIAVIITFALNRRWSFGDRDGSGAKTQFWRYLSVYAATFAFTLGFSWLFERAGIPARLTALATILMAACFSYFAMNLWVFKNNPSAANNTN